MNETDGGRCESGEFSFPIIEDTNRVLAKRLGMIDSEQYDSKGLPLTARAVRFPLIVFSLLNVFIRYLSLVQIRS
jgi:alkyl hydroperoxide reductase subunit AhpC